MGLHGTPRGHPGVGGAHLLVVVGVLDDHVGDPRGFDSGGRSDPPNLFEVEFGVVNLRRQATGE